MSTCFKELILSNKALLLFVTFASFFIIFGATGQSSALSGNEFNPGRIIDDSVFYNEQSMTVNEIQNFLNAKMPSCDTNGDKPYYSTGLTRKQWAQANGKPAPPYTCLKNYSQSIPSITNGGSDLCKKSIVGGTKTAANIILDVSKACGINPQVIIVLLQKEQALITDDWPWPVQYQKATGYGCPDTAPCDSQYYGFFNQVYQAAKAFRRYEANPNSYNYKANRNNYILYNPNTSCSGSTVYIQNQATASLYIYTPYQPNTAALNNLYGTGDGCSAYGNRNFWRMFNDWFGSTYGPSFSAKYSTQSPSFSTKAGETKTVQMSFKNTGTAFWKDDSSVFPGYYPVRLATTNSINRTSNFRAINWLTSNRPAVQFAKVYESDGVTLAADQNTVYPNQIARFEFNLTVPSDTSPGIYREYFQPVLEGSDNWDLGAQAWIEINVQATSYKATYVSQSAYPNIIKGYSKTIYFKFKNSGNATWYSDQSAPYRVSHVTLATSWPINRHSAFADSTWASPNRPVKSYTAVYDSGGNLSTDQSKVLPGQIAEFKFIVRGNHSLEEKDYFEYFQPILVGSSNIDMSSVAYLKINVDKPVFSASYVSQSAYPSIPNSQARLVYFKFRNTGNMFWKDDSSTFPGYYPVRLAATSPINRTSRFWHSALWAASNRPNGDFTKVYESDGVTLAGDQNTVHPGQIALFEFYFFVPPATPNGTYKEHFQPILEGASNWDMGVTAHLYVTVTD